MNLPNRLTVLRILLTVLFMILLFGKNLFAKTGALLVFLLASLTDYWDGKIAREKGQITRFGKLMDPIADKILTLSAFMAFVQMGIIPAWMVIAIISRDLLITGLRLLAPSAGDAAAARKSGKHKTVLQFLAIVFVLLFLALKQAPVWKEEWSAFAHDFIYLGMLFIVSVTLWSGIRYVWVNKELLMGNTTHQ
ncbi:MAG: CDP-diacylglycerol--glycerol-3-phosphate 3-phosphatidyltransferase [Candidatus Omnitrophica bacterium]|nr:CDP-diacylglycerol--glycerol-3-phosphate 3-phosphatidyltransferase [Candidatus Omnitrophota bacterium]